MKATTYGQKGGEGPTRGKKSATYHFAFPDGCEGQKRAFGNFERPTVYAYRHDEQWFAAGVSEANDPKFGERYFQCPAFKVGG